MLNGTALIETLIQASGLPPESLSHELERLLDERGIHPSEVTLEDVRLILANYLQDTLVEAKQSGPIFKVD